MYGKSRRPVGPAPGTQEQIQSFRKDRPYGPEGIHRILRQTTGGTSEREHTLPDFLWNYDSPVLPITNFKIVSAIRNEIASRLDIDSFQELLASHWKPYLDNLHVCMTDATCYESHMRFPTDMKLLWESLEWLYRHICRHCRELGIRRPRNKYRNVAESYLSYCKKERGELQGQECLSAV